MLTTSLIRRNHQPIPAPPIPAMGNRIIATYSGIPVTEFRDAGSVVQPAFQQAGYAPLIYVQSLQQGGTPREITVNDSGLFDTLILARPLYHVKGERAITPEEAIAFGNMAGVIAQGLTDLIFPKNWIGKRRSSSGLAPRPVMPDVNMTVEEAVEKGAGFESYLKGLPKYQRGLRAGVKGVQAAEDEIADFASFAGFHSNRDPGVWMDEEVGAGMVLKEGLVTLVIPSVPATPQPEAIYANLINIGERFAGEFGGTVVKNDEFANQIIVGWRNVLSRLGLQPGESEAREFFPPK